MTLKEFVEEYIDIIDSRNWYELFSIVYHMLENNRYAFDLSEFFELMKNIDSSFMQDTYEERKKLIEYYIEESYTHTYIHCKVMKHMVAIIEVLYSILSLSKT